MATTTLLDTDLQVKNQQKGLSPMALQEKNTNGEVKMSQAEKEKFEDGSKMTPLRANVAAPREALVGKTDDPYGYRNRKKTVLEQHCMLFDRDDDGVIWPIDTWHTCRSFGWGIRLSLFFTCFLHLVQSWGTVPWFWLIPDPLFRVWIHNIHHNKHGSSTMAFDHQGRFRQQMLDEFFEKNDRDGKDGLTFEEGLKGIRDHRFAWDIFGQISDLFEWGMTYVMIWPEDGVVTRQDAKRVLDGSIFHEFTKGQARYNGQGAIKLK